MDPCVPIEAVPDIALDSRLDPAIIRRVFQRSGRVHIPGILEPRCAERLLRCLAHETPWELSICDEQGPRDLPVGSFQEIESAERDAIIRSIEQAAAAGFAYRFSNFRIDGREDEPSTRNLYLFAFLRFLNSSAFLNFARAATGAEDISFADAQATLYRPGDFLTSHDDAVEGKHRRIAYVFNFTPTWRVEWGGLLAFPDLYGHLHEAFAPAFNALNLIRVPMPHTVTQVATFARGYRFSITGWLRTRS
jgi:Rps23 Pro-64 3,4-dihydroxylase Tpa1-like proline 4-hydroxylase